MASNYLDLLAAAAAGSSLGSQQASPSSPAINASGQSHLNNTPLPFNNLSFTLDLDSFGSLMPFNSPQQRQQNVQRLQSQQQNAASLQQQQMLSQSHVSQQLQQFGFFQQPSQQGTPQQHIQANQISLLPFSSSQSQLLRSPNTAPNTLSTANAVENIDFTQLFGLSFPQQEKSQEPDFLKLANSAANSGASSTNQQQAFNLAGFLANPTMSSSHQSLLQIPQSNNNNMLVFSLANFKFDIFMKGQQHVNNATAFSNPVLRKRPVDGSQHPLPSSFSRSPPSKKMKQDINLVDNSSQQQELQQRQLQQSIQRQHQTASDIDVSKLDVNSMMDVTSYAGVDLKEEEDRFRNEFDSSSSHQFGNPTGSDRSRIQDFMNADVLKSIVDKIATKNRINNVDDDIYTLIAFATQDRLRGLMERTILSAKHRVGFLHDQFATHEKAVALKRKQLRQLGANIDTDPTTENNGDFDDIMFSESVILPKHGPAGQRIPNPRIGLEVVMNDNVKNIVVALAREEKEREINLRKERGLPVGDEDDSNSAVQVTSGNGGNVSGNGPNGANHNDEMMGDVDLGTSGGKKKGRKSKKDKDVPESIKAKIVNQTALKIAGGKMKSWMFGGSAGFGGGSGDKVVPVKIKKKDTDEDLDTGTGDEMSASLSYSAGVASSNRIGEVLITGTKPEGNTMTTSIVSSKGERLGRIMTQKEMKRVGVKDILFTLERDRALRRGKTIYKWMANLK
ncbi:hypothetical protein HK096_003050 [Nowakowskiella sp. JEL0078]|nr:hypothetical protein HK096_003050 [Nowakowskiella sp. JEL0078]